MTPTASDLKSEITGGPLAERLAQFWEMVFPTEPFPGADAPVETLARWARLNRRFGRLTPDGVDGLLKTLSDKTLRSKPAPMSVATFTRFLASRGLLRRIKGAADDDTKPDGIRDICDLVVTLTQSAPDRMIDPLDAETAGMIQAMRLGGIVSQDDCDQFIVACTQPCSRLEELNWTITPALLIAARAL